ncbi:hypothetical protein CDL15_Pgr017520 [Punica granatum]|uniref:Uncharacterized protein n=1 Tax=Punica granatum TaxID=22663 RepID=A0A218W780_PUNGR|nr:hypothetical protein CDL15_Pgr017520 [Punica granatum]PKI61104.1 hypothetical protein CRG98_018496 [Punica granatum]
MPTAASSLPAASAQTNRNRLPPKRGQIKAQILESMVKTAWSAASKAGAFLGIRKGGGSSTSSASDNESPLLSSYNSDG